MITIIVIILNYKSFKLSIISCLITRWAFEHRCFPFHQHTASIFCMFIVINQVFPIKKKQKKKRRSKVKKTNRIKNWSLKISYMNLVLSEKDSWTYLFQRVLHKLTSSWEGDVNLPLSKGVAETYLFQRNLHKLTSFRERDMRTYLFERKKYNCNGWSRCKLSQ